MATIDNLKAMVSDLTIAAVTVPNEIAARDNLEQLAGIIQGLADSLKDRLRYGAYDVDGYTPPFRRDKG